MNKKVRIVKKNQIIFTIISIAVLLFVICLDSYDMLQTINSGKRLDTWKFVAFTIGSGTLFFFLYAEVFELFKEIEKKNKNRA